MVAYTHISVLKIILQVFPINSEFPTYNACYIHNKSLINSITPNYTISPGSSHLMSTVF